MAKENSSLIFCQLALHVSLRSPSWIPGPETKNRDVILLGLNFRLFFAVLWIHTKDMQIRTPVFILMRISIRLLMRLVDPDPCFPCQSDANMQPLVYISSTAQIWASMRLHCEHPQPSKAPFWTSTAPEVWLYSGYGFSHCCGSQPGPSFPK